MTNVQLVHFRDPRNGFDVMVSQAVTGVHLQTQAGSKGRSFGDTCQFAGLFSIGFRISIAAGVNFNIRRANISSRFNLFFIGIDKQRDQDPASARRLQASRILSR